MPRTRLSWSAVLGAAVLAGMVACFGAWAVHHLVVGGPPDWSRTTGASVGTALSVGLIGLAHHRGWVTRSRERDGGRRVRPAGRRPGRPS